MKQWMTIGLLSLSLGVSLPVFADWEMQTPADYSAAGALSAGAGVLYTLATPVVLTGAVLDSQNPVDISGQGVKEIANGVSATGVGVVYLLEGTRRGLSELTTDSILAGSTLVGTTVEAIKENIPTVTVTFHNQGQPVHKTIPLVVRPQYVEMHEKLEAQPCQ
jgi:hypothetical protein